MDTFDAFQRNLLYQNANRKSQKLSPLSKNDRSVIFFDKGDNFCNFLFAFWYTNPSENGFTLKGKNLLPWGADTFLLE